MGVPPETSWESNAWYHLELWYHLEPTSVVTSHMCLLKLNLIKI